MSNSGVVRGLFFDLDGTLFDTHAANAEAYQRAFAEHGHKVDPAAIAAEVRTGDRADVYVKRLVPSLTPDQVQQVMNSKVNHYAQVMHLVRPNHQLIDFLRSVAPHHVTVLVTTAKRVNSRRVMATMDIEQYFDHLVCGDEVTHSKPNPEIYLKALKLAGLEPHEVVAFEDSPSGLGAAQNAGIKVIKITMPQ